MIATATVLLALATLGAAQSGAYGQCGGIGWTGSTSCVSGYTCTYSNPYYSQCIPGGGSTTTKPSSTSAPPVSTTKPSSTAPVSTPTGKVGKLPALGWNSWNAYGCSNSEDKTLAAANQFISLGLKAAGYQYVNIDDCWSIQGARDSSGRIRPDTSKFPDGISGMATKIHNLGLLFGIYSDAGTNTCADYPGSLGNEMIDAQTFASWGVDYLKYDNCYVPSNWTDASSYSNWGQSNSAKRYKQMSAALATVSRPIEFNLCIWGQAYVWTWGATVGQSWRMTGDASATWSFISSAIANNANYLSSVNFYSHNDMDMMEIGNGALTIQEQRTHFAAWAFMKSPILLGTNLGNLNSQQLAIITNSELLAFSQDQTIGTPAMVFGNSNTSPPENYSGKSSKGVHVFIINTQGNTATKTITFANVPGLSGSSFKLHDMWAQADIGTFSGSWSTSLAAHDTGAWLITPA